MPSLANVQGTTLGLSCGGIGFCRITQLRQGWVNRKVSLRSVNFALTKYVQVRQIVDVDCGGTISSVVSLVGNKDGTFYF